MSPISIALNLLLASLLLATLLFGWILNRRLKALKDSHAGFTEAVAHLDRAAQRAEQGLADLRKATDQAFDLLSSRILKAREMADTLERLTAQAGGLAERAAAERASLPPSPRAFAERIAAERAHLHAPAAPAVHAPAPAAHGRPGRDAPARYSMTTEDEALAAAESLILKLSKSEALTNAPPPPRAAPASPIELRTAAMRRPDARPDPRPETRPEARAHPRSRAHVDDDLFEPPARGRLRSFDGGLA